MLLNGTILLCFLSCVCLVHAQGCAEPTDENIIFAIGRSLFLQTKTQTDVFLLNASIVCLASSGARDRYNFASVVATYITTDVSTDPVTAQFEFSCGTPSWFPTDAGVLGVNTSLNMKLLSADDPVLTAEPRTDCSTCIMSPTHPFAVRHSNLAPDNVTHCVACPDLEDCQKPSLCVLELPVEEEPVVECSNCNVLLEDGTCATECPSAYFINSNNSRTCECVLSHSSCSDGEWFSALQCKCEVCRCMNGGTCDPSSGECVCPPNYYGDLCSEYCSVECQNGGTLIPEPCTCSCPLYYDGENCETCTRECQNGGTLVTEYCTCVCPEYYTGQNCETCTIECQNGGTTLPENCTCSCPPNLYGDVCDVYCPRECQNGGTLIPESCSCLCAVNYTGEECACKEYIHSPCTCPTAPSCASDPREGNTSVAAITGAVSSLISFTLGLFLGMLLLVMCFWGRQHVCCHHQQPCAQQSKLVDDANAKSPLGSSETRELKEIEMECNSAYATTTYQ